MFQFPRFPSIRYGLAYGYLRFAQVGFPIRISPDQWIFAPPRSFSQLITSFIGSQCQGIPLALFVAWLLLLSFGSFTRRQNFLVVLPFKKILPFSHLLSSLFSFQGAGFQPFSRSDWNARTIAQTLQSDLGGDKRDRTADLLLARQALSQLS